MKVVCLTDMVFMSDTLVYEGQVIERGNWEQVENKTVKEGKFVRAGSVVEKTESQVNQMKKFKVYAPAETKLHFDLETLFNQRVTWMDSNISLADLLRSYSIHTIESFVNNEPGVEPLVGDAKKRNSTKKKAQEIVALHLGEEEAIRLLGVAKEIIAH